MLLLKEEYMQEKKSIMVVLGELKILSLRITVWHYSASFVMPNSKTCDAIFNPHLITIKGSYMSRAMRKCVLCHMRTTKAQIRLRIRAV